jgi:hypothetical protein
MWEIKSTMRGKQDRGSYYVMLLRNEYTYIFKQILITFQGL